jgi:hypothetical protein
MAREIRSARFRSAGGDPGGRSLGGHGRCHARGADPAWARPGWRWRGWSTGRASGWFRRLVGHWYERDEPFPYLPFAEIIEGSLAQAASLDDYRRRMEKVRPNLNAYRNAPPHRDGLGPSRLGVGHCADSLARGSESISAQLQSLKFFLGHRGFQNPADAAAA